MSAKVKLAVFLSLVAILAALPAFAGCASSGPTSIADAAIKIDWVDPIAMVPKSYDPGKSIALEYSTFHVIFKITNPNDFLIAVQTLDAEVLANDISMGQQHADGPIYVPGGKTVSVRIPLTENTRVMTLGLVVQKNLALDVSLKKIQDTWQAIQDGKATVQARGAVQLTADSLSKVQNFDLKFP